MTNIPTVTSIKEIQPCSGNRFIAKINAKFDLPPYLVKDVNFPFPLKKSSISESDQKLVFDTPKSDKTDFNIIFYKPENSNLLINIQELILSQEKFDIEVYHLDTNGNILSPKILLKDSQVITVLLPSLSYAPTTEHFLTLEVGFNCDHVILD